MLIAKELEELNNKYQNILGSFDLASMNQEIEQLQKQTEDPSFWTDTQKAQEIQQELATKNKKIDQINDFRELVENLEVAFELKDENEFDKLLKQTEKAYEILENETFLNGKFDKNNALITVASGAGGVDAQDFAAMLMQMYQGFAKIQEWKMETINLSSGEEGGVKSATFRLDGDNVYGLMKEEIGTHRLVRLSPFNAGHTRETSFASVEVVPQGLDEKIEIEIDEKDIRWDYFLSSGKGGQSVNTTYSAVRLVHTPTNISVTCQNERSQQQNKIQAMKYLKNKLAILELQKQKEFINDIKGIDKSADFGSQIRSYVMHPYKMVKDHRSNFESSDPDTVLTGNGLIDFIWSIKRLKK